MASPPRARIGADRVRALSDPAGERKDQIVEIKIRTHRSLPTRGVL